LKNCTGWSSTQKGKEVKTLLKREKGKPFLEIFASALNEDYRFPILEIFAFLYTLGTFAFASLVSSLTQSLGQGDAVAYTLTSSLLGFPLFIFVILILKNIAYGIGNDIEKGIVQTYLSYPLKRRTILTAKLLSALGAGLLLFLSIQLMGLFFLAPDIVGPYIGTVLLTYAASLSYPFLIAGIILLIALFLRRGGIALVVGIVLYFAATIVQSILMFLVYATNSWIGIQILSVISPSTALARYYQLFGIPTGAWQPSFAEVLSYVGGSYVIVACVFVLAYLYFSRRLNL
jgi:ABC-type transport system involved in multi-copper enzyme maturation permease subunit